MSEDDQVLWRRYKKLGDLTAREQLLKRHVPLVRFTLERMTLARGHAWLDQDDLITAGIIGLMDALEKFVPELGGKFSTYASFRIRGAVLDELRSLDWVPRSVRQKAREVENSYEILAQKLHRQATDAEMGKHLGLKPGQYQELLSEISVPPVVSLEELLEDQEAPRRDVLSSEQTGSRSFPGVLAEVAAQEMREILSREIESLPERERLVLTLYYYEELTMKEIAAVLEVTESRVCQIHAQAVLRLRAGLKIVRQDLAVS